MKAIRCVYLDSRGIDVLFPLCHRVPDFCGIPCKQGEKTLGKSQRHNILRLSLTPHMQKSSKQMCTRAKKNLNVCSDSYLGLDISVGVVQSALRGLRWGL